MLALRWVKGEEEVLKVRLGSREEGVVQVYILEYYDVLRVGNCVKVVRVEVRDFVIASESVVSKLSDRWDSRYLLGQLASSPLPVGGTEGVLINERAW